MKKLFLSLLCMSFVHGAFGAAADNAGIQKGQKVDLKDVSVVIRKATDKLDAEKKVYISGKTVSNPRDNHLVVFDGFALASQYEALSCASILHKGVVVGVIFYCQNDAIPGAYELNYIVIGAGYQRKGIGRCAMQQLEHLIKPKSMTLTALDGTESFYEGMGFKKTTNDFGNPVWVKKYA